jgi:DNA-binding NtrC family response regulator
MNNQTYPVLLVDDEQQILLSYSLILQSAGIEDVLTINDSRRVMPLLSKQKVSLIVLDLFMPFISGTELLSEIKQEFPHIPVIIMTATNELDKAVECMKIGATDYLVKPVEKGQFILTIKKALELRDLNSKGQSDHFGENLKYEHAFASIITGNKKMLGIFHYVESIAELQKPVLITGETGVGKELIASAIHKVSGLNGKFIPVNTAGLDDTMFADTLFGHKRGAFTGADRERKGLIVQASDGTLLLDEIGDLSHQSQLKLLRLLDENVFYPLGSDHPENSNARVIASTNRNVKKLIEEEKFREDLYFRLKVYSIHVPPLRERLEDIPLLLNNFIEEAVKFLNKKKPAYPSELITFLSNYNFPGNIREMKAMVFNAVAHHRTGKLSMDSFKTFIKEQGLFSQSRFLPLPDDIDSIFKRSGKLPTIKEAEEYLISEALKRSKGNQGIAASFLGITRHALNKRLKRKGCDNSLN